MSEFDAEYREENMDIDENIVEEEEEEEEEAHSSSKASKRRKKSKITKTRAAGAPEARPILKRLIDHDEYSKAMGELFFDSLERMSLSGVRPDYSDGTSPSMEEEFQGMDKQSTVTSIAKDVFFPVEHCHCQIAPCFDPETIKSKSNFYYKRDLLLHIMYEHFEEDENDEFACPYTDCNLTLNSRSDVIDHLCIKKHLNLRIVGCQLCPARYHDLSVLLVHMQTHANEKSSHQEQEVDENNELINKFKTVFTPKYAAEQLIITFNNFKNPLIIKEKSLITKIQQQKKRYIEFRLSGDQFSRKCALAGCNGRAVGGELCIPCKAIIGDINPPFKYTKPERLLNINDDSHDHYYLTEIQNSKEEWITICGNQECCMMFNQPNNQSFCSEVCKNYYLTNPDDAFTPPPPSTPQGITDLWPLTTDYNQVNNNSFTLNYNQTPVVVENNLLPNRHLQHVFNGEGWNITCVVHGCTSKAMAGRICTTHRNRSVANPGTPLPLKRKPDNEHNFQVTINTINNQLSFTRDDIIWSTEVYDGRKWSRKCGKWECPNICSAADPLLCRIHTSESTNNLPPYVTAESLRQSRSRTSSAALPPSQQPLPPPAPVRTRPRRRGASQ